MESKESTSSLGIIEHALLVWMQDFMDIPTRSFSVSGVVVSTKSIECFWIVVQFGESA